jgi:hypothetical protein
MHDETFDEAQVAAALADLNSKEEDWMWRRSRIQSDQVGDAGYMEFAEDLVDSADAHGNAFHSLRALSEFTSVGNVDQGE